MAAERTLEVDALLDRPRLSRLQVGVLVLCALVALVDGVDRQGIGLVSRNLMGDLHLSATRMGFVFSVDNVGAVLGAVLCGQFADRFGRRPVLIFEVAVIAVFTFLTAHASSFATLALCRFMTGLGLGGAPPCFLALAAEFVPKRLRGGVASWVFAAYPVGGALGGLWTAYILRHFQWPSVFYIDAAVSLTVLLLLVIGLPESMQVLARRGGAQVRLLRTARRIAPDLAAGSPRIVNTVLGHTRQAGSIRELFRGGLAVPTLVLWSVYFFAFATINIVQIWLPGILSGDHITPSGAALVAGAWNVGFVIGMLLAGALAIRTAPGRRLAAGLLVAAATLVTAGAVHGDFALLVPAIVLNGVALGLSAASVTAIASTIYPSENRSTGVGAGFAASRFGQVLAPMLVAFLIDASVAAGDIMYLVGVLPLVAGLLAVLLASGRTARAA